MVHTRAFLACLLGTVASQGGGAAAAAAAAKTSHSSNARVAGGPRMDRSTLLELVMADSIVALQEEFRSLEAHASGSMSMAMPHSNYHHHAHGSHNHHPTHESHSSRVRHGSQESGDRVEDQDPASGGTFVSDEPTNVSIPPDEDQPTTEISAVVDDSRVAASRAESKANTSSLSAGQRTLVGVMAVAAAVLVGLAVYHYQTSAKEVAHTSLSDMAEAEVHETHIGGMGTSRPLVVGAMETIEV